MSHLREVFERPPSASQATGQRKVRRLKWSIKRAKEKKEAHATSVFLQLSRSHLVYSPTLQMGQASHGGCPRHRASTPSYNVHRLPLALALTTPPNCAHPASRPAHADGLGSGALD